MDIKIVKDLIIDILEKSINAKHNSDWSRHPLRVVQAVKSLIGINISTPNLKLIDWLENYSNSFSKNSKLDLGFRDDKLNETISAHHLELALREGDKLKSYKNLEQLSRVSEGRPILEFLLELSLQQSGQSFLFIMSVFRSNLFSSNRFIDQFLILSADSILDDKFKISHDTDDYFNLNSKFELCAHMLACKKEEFVRNQKINAFLPGVNSLLKNTDSSNCDKSDILGILTYGRKAILKYLDIINKHNINIDLILKLDALRAALKASPENSVQIINASSSYFEGLSNAR